VLSIKKAIKLLDWWINQREEKIQKLESNFKSMDSEIKSVLFENEKTVITNLKLIKKELTPKCKHPKKMQDTCNGVKYCMNCNMDL